MTITTTLKEPTTPKVAISFLLEFSQDYGDKNLQWNQKVQDLKEISIFSVEFCCPHKEGRVVNTYYCLGKW